MNGRIRVAVSLLAATLTVSSAYSADLLEVYQRAAQNDPLIREAEANRLAAREAKPRALSALLPQIVGLGSMSTGHQDGGNTFPQVINPDDPATRTIVNVPTTFESDTDRTQYEFRLTQSVFRWDQWMTLKQSDSQVAQAEANYIVAEQDLLVRTCERYFDVLAAEDTLQSATTARDAISRQLEQANKRFEVGLIAITDVQEAKAAFDNANAVVIDSKRALATAHEQLRELTGDPFEQLSKLSQSMPLKTPDPQDEEQWVKTAMDQNSALISSRLAAEIARDTISIRRGGHFPTLDLVASHSDFDSDQTTTTRQGTTSIKGPTDSNQTDDTISLQLVFPIYSGGAVSSSVREAVYLHRAARERLEATARSTERETRDAYLGVLSELSRVQALRQALESSRTALQATEAGYEVGTRTAVDVLDARRRLAQAETDYARSRYDYVLNVVRLKRAAGTLQAQEINDVNQWLTATAVPPQPQPQSGPSSNGDPQLQTPTPPAQPTPPPHT
ncbi:MAG TPA: TolC family outer membrane protein [Steroidobacteraceae bacterium]|jgi:outer membrane protein|nr:TolC family outer membrane protein [Steroidobacteraceae bacterium]